ncbi:hypothetical protein [Croceicoccus gelatinilyticus]|uniref:hypothetical protein n=1 Tax=Croceicoccus gelatinilyticus TaxID=2835536 RepID=UPI001BCE4C02|nr:hypothetical protein [Croceicoccus gelatinilyticus]MBS7670964.1 hypothetical protein [Croceicoccus gelatinilyticus]
MNLASHVLHFSPAETRIQSVGFKATWIISPTSAMGWKAAIYDLFKTIGQIRFMTVGELILGVLIVALPMAISGCGDSDTAATIPRDPPVRLVQPDWLPLTGSEIEDTISGMRLSIDDAYEVAPGLKPKLAYVGGCLPTEVFHADGQWKTSFCSTSPVDIRGRWLIEKFRGGEHLCVEAPDLPITCRFVWRGRKRNRLFMPATVLEYPTTRNELGENVFNPYLLTPVDP